MMSGEFSIAELVAVALALEEEETKATTQRKYAVHPLNGQGEKKEKQISTSLR